MALFAAGFAFRPLGALIFGVVGDRLGRKGAFLVTVSLMGGATFLIGLLPTYAQAGALAPLAADPPAHSARASRLAANMAARPSTSPSMRPTTGAVPPPAGSSRRPRSACSPRLLVILATRSSVGEDAFAAWGWRIPFLVSAVLLAISVWMRAKLAESPAFAKLKSRRDLPARRCARPSPARDNLKRVLIAFFGIMCAQGAVWYFTFFYLQVFLEKSLGLPGATKDLLLIAMTVVSAPLYVFFGWLSDRVGRKPVMLGGMLLALVALFPGFALDRRRRPTRRWSPRSGRRR